MAKNPKSKASSAPLAKLEEAENSAVRSARDFDGKTLRKSYPDMEKTLLKNAPNKAAVKALLG